MNEDTEKILAVLKTAGHDCDALTLEELKPLACLAPWYFDRWSLIS